MAMIYMTLCAAVFVIFREPLVGWFVNGADISPERARNIIDIGAKLMICTAVFQTADAFGIIYTGALRGAGDTVWPGVVTAIYSWVFIIGGGFAFIHFAPQLESLGPWIASAVYVILYGLTMWLRFHGGKWRSIDLLQRGKCAECGYDLRASATVCPECGASVESGEGALKHQAARDAPVLGGAPEPLADAGCRGDQNLAPAEAGEAGIRTTTQA